MSFQTLSKFFLGLSTALVAVSIVLFITPGPKFSIEFTGGTLLQLQLPEGKTEQHLRGAIASYEASGAAPLGNVNISTIKTASEDALLLRLQPMTNEEHVALMEHIRAELGDVRELKYTTIGPSLSASLKSKSFQAIAFASLVMIVYLALAFRKLPRALKPWKFGLLAVIAFLHDVLITTGIFIIIGRFTSFEFDTLFVTALLTIVANSTNEAIMVFDRIRANLTFENRSENFASIVVTALRQCVWRTAGTTVSILIMLCALFFLGAESIRWFILALIVGTVIGAYSSYFVAAPLLLYWK